MPIVEPKPPQPDQSLPVPQPPTRPEAPEDPPDAPAPIQARADYHKAVSSGLDTPQRRETAVPLEPVAHDPPTPTQAEADKFRAGEEAVARHGEPRELPAHDPPTPTQAEADARKEAITRSMTADSNGRYQTR